jgi:hypothetical protein
MPLTLELYNSSDERIGHLIIDRENLIFALPFMPRPFLAKSRKDRLIQSLKLISDTLIYLVPKEDFIKNNDPLHGALEHLSSYDQYHCAHCHFTFAVDVNLNHLRLIFEHPAMKSVEDLISPECRHYILEVSEKYFHDLANSPVAKTIEKQYREEKDIQYQRVSPRLFLSMNNPFDSDNDSDNDSGNTWEGDSDNELEVNKEMGFRNR